MSWADANSAYLLLPTVMKRRWSLWSTITVAALVVLQATAQTNRPSPILVFLLVGQSNMEGQSVVDLDGPDYNDGKGTLAKLLLNPTSQTRFPALKNPSGSWKVWENVHVWYRSEVGEVHSGPLTFGFTPYGDSHHFGPEFGFGRILGSQLTNKILLIKTAWGGKSLYADFRPPSSGGTIGPYYRRMLTDIHTALTSLGLDPSQTNHPSMEWGGLVWYQGWNDGIDPKNAIPAYETNLVHFIDDVRRDLGAPHLPVVIGELTGAWVDAPSEWTRLRHAQAASADHPEYAGNVVFVSTREFVRRPEDSPNPGHGHHEFGNAETGLLVGEAMGKGMLELLPIPGPEGYQSRSILGWTVHVQDRLWRTQKASTDLALSLLERQLAEIVQIVPPPAVERLRSAHLWFSASYPGVPPRAEYHPGADWLREQGRNPAMVHGVEFTDISDFAPEMNRMPNFVLHELAHAYHDQVLGFESPAIQAAYDHAKASGKYRHVERWNGNGRPNTTEEAYAMTNAQEYFAESTEAYFSRNDFFPFTRDELHRHDPEMYELLQRVWGVAH